MSKNKKIVIGILIAVVIIVIGLVVVYKLIENSVTNREDFNFKVENSSSNPVETVNNEKNAQSYSKVIDNMKVVINTVINHFSSELSFLFSSLFDICFAWYNHAPFLSCIYIMFLDGKSLSKFYGLGLVEFLYFPLNITI